MRRRSFVFLAVCSLAATASVATPTVQQSPSGEMEKSLQELFLEGFAELLRTGPVDPKWSEGGADIEAELLKRPGGAERNYLLSVDKDGDRGLEILTNEPIATLAPNDWTLVASTGDIDRTLPGNRLSISIHDGYAMAVRGNSRKVGSAECMGEIAGAHLYGVPAKPAADDLPEQIMIMIFRATIDYMSKQPVCARYDREGNGFVIRNFMDDGRTLPKMDELEGTNRLVPAAPVATLLAGD